MTRSIRNSLACVLCFTAVGFLSAAVACEDATSASTTDPTAFAAPTRLTGQGPDNFGKTFTARNVRVVAYSDLNGRGGGFKMAIQQVAGRWYL
jgi:hypothetical protein